MKKDKIAYILLVVALVLLPFSSLAADKALRFGVFPYKSPKEMMKLFLPIARQLEEAIGRPVHLVTTPNAVTFNQRAIAGDYDLIWACNTCYLQIHAKAGYEVVARGYPSFQGGVIVRKDSHLSELSQLQGKKIAAIGKGSYAGYQFFANSMEVLGYTMPGAVKVSFLRKLDSIVFSVVGRQYDAGIIRLDALASHRFARVRDQLTVIHTSTVIPQFPFAVNPGTDQELIAQIIEVLTGINNSTPQGKDILQKLKIKGIETCMDHDYDGFRTVFPGAHW